MLDEKSFDPDEFENTQSDDEKALDNYMANENKALDIEKENNIIANDKIASRRKRMKPWVNSAKNILEAAIGVVPDSDSMYDAFVILYDRVYNGLSQSMDGSVRDASEWMHLAKTLIELDEYALMENNNALQTMSSVGTSNPKITAAYDQITKTCRNVDELCRAYLQIGFALIEMTEKAIEAYGDAEDAEDVIGDYIDAKTEADETYGPLFRGLESHMGDMMRYDRRYGRETAR